MASTLDPAIVRCAPPQEVAQHLQAVLQKSSEEGITLQLIHYIDIGLITPSVFKPWLRISTSSLRQALRQEVSVEVRRLAIKELRKRLRSSQWRLIWELLGGIQGWVYLFSRFSVLEIKEACQAIGTSARGIDCEPKRKMITQLFKALLPRFFSKTPESTQDERSLANQYRRLLPACTADLVSKAIDKDLGGMEGISYDMRQRLLQFHSDTLQAAALRYVFENYPAGKEWLSPLLCEQPSETATPRGYSASMMFSFSVLQRMVKEESASLSVDLCMNMLVRPLLKRAVKKKAEWSMTREIVDLTVKYLELHPDAADGLDYEPYGLLHLVGVCWAHKPGLFETQFEILLRCSRQTNESISFYSLEGLFSGVSKSRCFALLRFCFKVTTGCDINVEKDLEGGNYCLSYTLLNGMRAEEALGLFSRLQSAQGGEFVGLAPSLDHVLGYSPTLERRVGDPSLWHIVLLRRNGREEEAEQIAAKSMQVKKTAAMSSSIPEQRAFYARSVFNFAIASESLDLYQQAHEWAQRYTRDPLVVKELYQHQHIDARMFFSGVPERIGKGMTSFELHQRVKLANRILRSLFDMACSALREPSFTVHNWHGTLCLFLHAVRHRIDRSTDLKNVLGISDEEIYDLVWKDTLTTLIAVEEKALAPGHERLGADSLAGILHYHHGPRILLQNELPSTYRFLDDLARARDDLWRRYRPTIHPAASSLPEPFPRGLPIQHLTEPFTLDTISLETLAPYIASRRDAVVFPTPSLARVPIPSDEETQTAIGVFVDDYYFGLRLFLPTMLSKEEKMERIDRAWAHATGPLSQGRMSPEEAVRFWQPTEVYNGLLLGKITLREWPSLPEFNPSSNGSEVEEWDLRPDNGAEIKARTLETSTYIDISKMISRRSYESNVHSTMAHFVPTIPGVEQVGVWSTARVEQAKGHPKMREGQILSALLYLDTFNSTKTRMLAKSFPTSASYTRYPALYLDGQFLTEAKSEKYDALAALEAHRKSVPAPLLAQVAENTMRTLDATSMCADGYVEIERLAFALVELLGRSDRPALISKLAVRAIIQRPDASSWHRRLLSRGYFRRLSADSAQACISLLADAIIVKLDEQAKAKEVKKEMADIANPPEASLGDKAKESRSFIKVTTVKFLAQLLSDTEFVSEGFALSVLQKLIEKASHIDIRREVVNSLLNMFETAPPTSAERILIALETIVPVAGNIRERRPIADSDWARADETLELPELDPVFSFKGGSAPMLESLLKFLRNQPRVPPAFTHRGAFIERIVMPVLESLQKQTMKWVYVFLRKYGLDEAAQRELNIPSLPFHKDITSELLRSGSSHLPLSVLEDYVAYLSFNIAPPAIMKSFIKKLKDNRSLHNTSEVQVFLGRFGAGAEVVHHDSKFHLVHLLDAPSQLQGNITVKNVQEQYLKLYTTMLWHDADTFMNLRYITQPLWGFTQRSEVTESWAEHYKPIVEAIILYVEGIRTRKWQKDPNRRPSLLPDTYLFRMWLLQHSAQHSLAKKSGDHEAHCENFATRVAKISDSLAGTLYHSKFQLLKEALEYVRDNDRIRVALYLGDISKTTFSWLTMQDLLRVELAAGLLASTWGRMIKDEELEKKVNALRGSWKKSDSEEVRRLSFGLGEGNLIAGPHYGSSALRHPVARRS